MTYQQLQNNRQYLLLECITGSKAYGLDLPTSDTDIKGVFYLPKSELLGMTYTPQVNDEGNDQVYYELGRFIELLYKNNPNLLELLSTDGDAILYQHPIMESIKAELFLSKLCKSTFAGYAFTQIRKARGLNKKIVNPMKKEKKTLLEFCYVLYGQGSIPVKKWLELKGWQQENCGLVNMPHAKDVYGIFYDPQGDADFQGIIRKNHSTKVALSSIPKAFEPVAYLHFNEDGYKKYCKDYKEYWEWVNKRNEARYENTIASGKNYDAKNMMHTFRLLDMAEEIAIHQKVIVKRPNRDFLLQIRRGEMEYKDLVERAEQKAKSIEKVYEQSKLMEKPDYKIVNQLLIDLRNKLYY